MSRHLPVAVYLTGLPDFEDMAGARKGATFARRFRTVTLGPLDEGDILEALQPFVIAGWETAGDHGAVETVRMDPATAKAIAALSCGEPFLFQLAGQRAWNVATAPVVSEEDVVAGWRGAESEARSPTIGRSPPAGRFLSSTHEHSHRTARDRDARDRRRRRGGG